MSTLGMVQLLYGSLVLVMTGLGLSLRAQDFRVIQQQRRAVVGALFLQMVVMPAAALVIAVAFRLPGALAVGMMILAATPGSISANIFSHLFGGNVALNVALTGLNTVLCALTLPIIGHWATGLFTGTGHLIPIFVDRAIETVSIVTVPVVAGMMIAARWPRWAVKVAKPVKVLSGAVVLIVSVLAIVKEWAAISAGFTEVGTAILLFNVFGLAIGYAGAKALNVGLAERLTITFQVSVHNAIQAVYVGLAVLNEPLVAVPAAVYSITMNLLALAFGLTHDRIQRGVRLRVSSA